MSVSAAFIIIALAVGFGAAAVAERMRSRALRHYCSRPCQGGAWKRAFPAVQASEIRAFLRVFTTSFGFRSRQGLSFSPSDSVLQIYRACYPIEDWPDALELETFDRELDVRYAIDLRTIWRESLTLGEVFAIRPNNPLQLTAGGKCEVDS